MEENKKVSSASSIAALTLGIISIVGACMWYIGGICGIIAIITGAIGIKKTQSKSAKAGLVCGIVGLALCAVLYVTVFIALTFSI
jgi:hypothetical protein